MLLPPLEAIIKLTFSLIGVSTSLEATLAGQTDHTG